MRDSGRVGESFAHVMSFTGNLDCYSFSLPRRTSSAVALSNSMPATRNRCLLQVRQAGLCASVFLTTLASASVRTTTLPHSDGLSVQDTALLTEIQQRAVLYFQDHSDPHTGLTRDRAPADGRRGTAASSI